MAIQYVLAILMGRFLFQEAIPIERLIRQKLPMERVDEADPLLMSMIAKFAVSEIHRPHAPGQSPRPGSNGPRSPSGQKFGTRELPAVTWMTNVVVTASIADRYRSARIVALSSGNVYPLVPVASDGASEGDPVGPVGEYAASCIGRERVMEHAAQAWGTRVSLVRLNYAVPGNRRGPLVSPA